MSETNRAVNRIWRPNVEPIGAQLSELQFGMSSMAPATSSRYFTKTSLRHDRSADPEYHLNCAKIDATQSHNSTAQPFSRRASASLVSSPPHQERAVFRSSQPQGIADHRVQPTAHHREDGQPPQKADQNMSPQLVHKQYNSPMDLYSMNNIRKTIEAHSELLAPGVKGINFMKAESPINKQSEVYKLVKEEEEEQCARLRQPRSGSSAVGGGEGSRSPGYSQQQAPLAGVQVPNLLINGQRQSNASERGLQYASEHTYRSSRTGSSQERSAQLSSAAHYPPPASCQSAASETRVEPQPKCCECDQSIVGPFAKLQNRFVHPHCFNCSTCGSSLKNSGYFTINDKLYCEIHARQVANVMRLNYNFEPNKQTIDNTRQQYDDPSKSQLKQQRVIVQTRTSAEDCQRVQQQQQHQSQPQPQPQHQVHSTTLDEQQQRQPSKEQLCNNCRVTLKKPATTISTMFASRSDVAGNVSGCAQHKCNGTCHGCSCSRSEIRWSWRPACNTSADKQTEVSSSTGSNARHFEHESHRSLKQRHESRLASSSAPLGTLSSTPICCHCRVQVHGPYVLAGTTTWCKPCSQTNFVCSSCHRSLLNVGFIEDSETGNKYYCENCFEAYLAPICAKCQLRIKGQDCLKALGKSWHPSCFVCGHCKCPFGNSSFYLEDNVPYCERDWNLLFTTKCYSCSNPIEVGDKWIEALERSYHSDCFRCTACQLKLEGSTFYCKGNKPYCQMHAR